MHNRLFVGLGILLCGFLAAIPYYRHADQLSPSPTNSTLTPGPEFTEQPLQLSIATPHRDPKPAAIQGLNDAERIMPLRIEATSQPLTARPVGHRPTVPRLEESFPEVVRPDLPPRAAIPNESLRTGAAQNDLPQLLPAN